jgi:phospholipid/cholesterol/gamma-HCH transport system substrate-binding protein
MDDKVNYTLVGAFVLALGGALVAGVLWLAAGLGTRQAMDAYQAVIRESVAGLSVDAPVTYLGVAVGKVDRIEIDPHNSQQVRLHFLVGHGTPVKRDSAAVLKTQGLTGIAYVEISGGSIDSPPLRVEGGDTPVIPFKPSLSARLENVLSTVLANVDRVSNNLNAVLSSGNQEALHSTLADLALLAGTLAAQRATVSKGLTDAGRAAQWAAHAGEQLQPTLTHIAQSAQAIERMADVARQASSSAGDTADAATHVLAQFNTETLPALAQLAAELNLLAASLRHLSDQTTTTPNSLLVGRPPPQPGPGEATP